MKRDGSLCAPIWKFMRKKEKNMCKQNPLVTMIAIMTNPLHNNLYMSLNYLKRYALNKGLN